MTVAADRSKRIGVLGDKCLHEKNVIQKNMAKVYDDMEEKIKIIWTTFTMS